MLPVIMNNLQQSGKTNIVYSLLRPNVVWKSISDYVYAVLLLEKEASFVIMTVNFKSY